MLGSTTQPLTDVYDLALLDLDGVVYIGAEAVPGAATSLQRARAAGMHLAFVTNNASRPPASVAKHLSQLGIEAEPHEVVTSAQAAAGLLARDLPPASPVFVIGGAGLEDALVEHGLVPTSDIDAEPVAVVSGYHPDLRWRTVIDGAILVRRGLPWVASNTDATVPTPHGSGPGNGVLVRAVAEFADCQPRVAGKPEPPLFSESIERVGGQKPLVVGDRLDTDIAGAHRCDLDSLLVLTGVTGLGELIAAPPELRPTYIAADLSGLHTAHPGVQFAGDSVTVGDWVAHADPAAENLVVTGSGTADDWWRTVAEAAWRHHDRVGTPFARVEGVRPVALNP